MEDNNVCEGTVSIKICIIVY